MNTKEAIEEIIKVLTQASTENDLTKSLLNSAKTQAEYLVEHLPVIHRVDNERTIEYHVYTHVVANLELLYKQEANKFIGEALELTKHIKIH